MTRAPALIAGLAALLALGVSAGGQPAAAAAGSCSDPTAPQVPGAVVQSITGVDTPAGTDQIPGGPSVPNVPAHCAVSVYLTHPGVGDHVLVSVWLPDSGWNGRFQGTGGGGYAAGEFDVEMAPAIQQGYAAAGTDAGVPVNAVSPAAWALKPDGSVNTGLLTNFASRSLHDMTVAAKQVVTGFYGRAATYSYWNGCSTGGRQGLMEAQRYPSDYNGILADAPAINWDRFLVAEFWPQVVMNQRDDHPGSCVLNAFTQAAVAACDKGDPVAGGIIDQPLSCRFDPRSLIGDKVACNGTTVTITAADAEVVRQIWQGPGALWYGLTKGTPLDALAGSAPFPISDSWIRYFLARNPGLNTATITYSQFAALFEQSRAEYNRIIGTDDPDLTAFERAGGKLVTWHGLADPLIFPQGTIDYYQRVQRATGDVDSFYRLFLAPGVGHCGAGNGPAPTDALGALVTWVEHGRAPATLAAATVDSAGATITRNLCAYPKLARYTGHGDPDSAASYRCT